MRSMRTLAGMEAFDDQTRFMVCLYGIELGKADIVPWLADADALFCGTGQHPSHLSIEAPGFGKRALLFDRAWKRLQRADPESLVDVEMYALEEKWRTLGDWIAVSSVHTEFAYLEIGTSLVAAPDVEAQVMGLVGRWLERIRPAYGIAFYRPRGRGPDAYGIGLAYGGGKVFDGPEYEEGKAINRWSAGMRGAVYDQGILRDVYPCSLLTARHLEREAVDGVSLEEWVRAEPWRGDLAGCEHGYTLWTVDAAHLARVRRELARAGALYVLPRDNHL